METIQKTFLENKLQWLKYCCINCHPSMKPYYQSEYQKYKELIEQK